MFQGFQHLYICTLLNSRCNIFVSTNVELCIKTFFYDGRMGKSYNMKLKCGALLVYANPNFENLHICLHISVRTEHYKWRFGDLEMQMENGDLEVRMGNDG